MAAPAGAALAEDTPHARFTSYMDSVFGAGTWRITGGYRTPARENELRAQGALTVPRGVLSRHSIGTPSAPGAYDVVVDGLSPQQAAAKLRRSEHPFRTIFAEGAHGTQGPHLHLALHSTDFKDKGSRPPGIPWIVTEPTPAELAVTRLRAAAVDGDARAQLELGQVYSQGRVAPRDLVASYVWTALAASNSAVDPDARGEAKRILAALTARMQPAEIERARLFARPPAAAGDQEHAGRCQTGLIEASVIVLVPDIFPRSAADAESCAGPGTGGLLAISSAAP